MARGLVGVVFTNMCVAQVPGEFGANGSAAACSAHFFELCRKCLGFCGMSGSGWITVIQGGVLVKFARVSSYGA